MKKVLLTLTAVSLISACASDPYSGERKVAKTTYGTGIGAILGAGIGQLIGGSTEATLIGAAVGAAAGAATGGYMDVQANKLRQELVGTGVQVQKAQDGSVHLIMPGNITFDTDKDNIKESFKPVLDSVAKVINEFDKTQVQVIGHTDNTGTPAYNQTLSQKRAKMVADYLNLRNVNSARLSVIGAGQNQPITSNATESGREQNRRVEISLINMQ